MTLTRRELLMAAAAPLALVPDGQAPQAGPDTIEAAGLVMSAYEVPDALALARWEHSYRHSYARDHAPAPWLRGAGTEQNFVVEDNYDATTRQGAFDTLARLEAEVPPDHVADHGAIAAARGAGFLGRTTGALATHNPFWKVFWDPSKQHEHDLFMSWHAGWVQADPDLKLPRTFGYTQPPTRST